MLNGFTILNDLHIPGTIHAGNIDIAGSLTVPLSVYCKKVFAEDADVNTVVSDAMDTLFIDADVGFFDVLVKGSGTFKIDHPLDPENKYLSHSFVESPDMLNVYNGNVVFDGRGQALVELPSYFEALNRDFRYHLTCIGGFAPVYVAEEVAGSQFHVAGGAPGLKVSWQVTGIRQDPFADQHRVVPEQDKRGAERGKYLFPAAYGKTEEHALRRLPMEATQR